MASDSVITHRFRTSFYNVQRDFICNVFGDFVFFLSFVWFHVSASLHRQIVYNLYLCIFLYSNFAHLLVVLQFEIFSLKFRQSELMLPCSLAFASLAHDWSCRGRNRHCLKRLQWIMQWDYSVLCQFIGKYVILWSWFFRILLDIARWATVPNTLIECVSENKIFQKVQKYPMISCTKQRLKSSTKAIWF